MTADPGPRERRGGPFSSWVFRLVLLAAIGLLFVHPWWELVLAPQWDTAATVSGSVVFAAALVGMFALMVVGHGRRHVDPAAAAGDLLLGVMWILGTWAVLAELLRAGLAIGGVADPGRSRWVALVLGAVTVLLVGYGLVSALKVPRVRTREIHLAGLGPALDGLRLVVLADTHFGPLPRTWWSRRLATRAAGLAPDVLVHAGDLVDGTVAQRAVQVLPMAGIAAEHRVYITGNHEYATGAQEWVDFMSAHGWDALHNQHHLVRRGADTLVVAGVDDRTAAGSGEPGHGADLVAALAGAPAGAPVVLLAHQPRQARVAAHGVALQISGHTHGGQIWPFHHIVRAEQGHLQGLRRVGDTQLWITRGAGFWGPPLRVFAPSEISLLVLRSAG